MSHAVWLVRTEALPLGQKLAAALDAQLYQPWLDADASAREQFRAAFLRHSHWILVMASGIAVRYLDGLPQSKYRDPAVVVMDEAARFAIPLLSGHEGGANDLAYQAARLTGAIPAVTTATEAIKPLTLGIGCRRGKSAEAIEQAVLQALAGRDASSFSRLKPLPQAPDIVGAALAANPFPARLLSDVREVATIDLKADEAGLLAFCRRHALPLRVIAREDVAARGWTGAPSDWVRQNIGVDGVCEPCALIASPRGRLIVPKTALDGVTVAVVEDRT